MVDRKLAKENTKHDQTAPEQAQLDKPSKKEPTKPLTVHQLTQELQSLKDIIQSHSQLIAELQRTLARKRRPVHSSGKVQIKDKFTGAVYPSKNNAYQSLLKSGELKELVDKGIFGPMPEKNTFGWYVLMREWPDRFEEVHQATEAQNTK